jgi:ankyrin repeat protein
MKSLHECILKGDVQTLRSLLENKADPNVYHEGEPVIFTAMTRGIPNGSTIVDSLLEFKADIRATNEHGRSVLYVGVIRDMAPVITRHLLTPETKNEALRLMIRLEDSDCLEAQINALLDDGAGINASDADGDTPLHLAVSRGCSVFILELLLKRGAAHSLSIHNSSYRTPMDIARFNGFAYNPSISKCH